MIVAYLYLIFACVYKYLKHETLESCILEITLILVLSLVVQYVHLIHEEGRRLREDLSGKETKKDRIKCYLFECNFIALFLTSIVYLGITFGRINVNFYGMQAGNVSMAIILGVILCYLVMLLISFGCNYWISEKLVEKNTKRKRK